MTQPGGLWWYVVVTSVNFSYSRHDPISNIMKTLLCVLAAAPLLLAQALAGVKGVYPLTGTVTEEGERFSVTAKLTVLSYNKVVFAYQVRGGERGKETFNLPKAFRETTKRQVLTVTDRRGTATVTLWVENGRRYARLVVKGSGINGEAAGSKGL